MNQQEMLAAFGNLRMAPANGGRAIHKPLLILFWLGRLERGESRLARFAVVEEKFKRLLVEFGASNSPQTRQLPFWHLCNDAGGVVWELRSGFGIQIQVRGGAPGLTWFRQNEVQAGFVASVDEQLRSDRELRTRLAKDLLSDHFPPTLHADIAAQVGLDLDAGLGLQSRGTRARRRDPAFRDRVLRAYEYRCCVCGFDLRIGTVTAGLEAAHIQWFTAGGPDVETNGFALCSLHHKLLDLGAFTVEPVNLTMRFSQDLQLGDATRAHLLSYHGAGIIAPQSTAYRPERQYLEWHGDEVFKKPGRD
ncbi:MAG: phosphorothioated DNA-binding restriction endonuclease [Betaproteobacteria bacterium]